MSLAAHLESRLALGHPLDLAHGDVGRLRDEVVRDRDASHKRQPGLPRVFLHRVVVVQHEDKVRRFD